MVSDQLAQIGMRLSDQVAGFGRFTRFCGAAAWWVFVRPGKWCRAKLMMPLFYEVGTRSAPVIMLVGAFIGMVLSVEMYSQFKLYGQEHQLGGVIGIAVLRHIGPVLAAIMLAGRVGGAVSAELGTMRVTEQIDALRAMGADPIAHLVVPRIVACMLMIPLLTVFSDLLGIFGGYLVTVRGFGVSGSAYWEFAAWFIEGFDVVTGLIKSVVFGLSIGVISCYKGFYCGSGAEGVGKASTDSFVTSFIAIIIANFVLAKFLKDVYTILYGSGGF